MVDGEKVPYMCDGYILNNTVVYLSDVSGIPESTWSILDQVPDRSKLTLIIDSIWLGDGKEHTSHMSLPQVVETVLRLRPGRTYLVGLDHPMTHFEWEAVCDSISGRPSNPENSTHPLRRLAKDTVERFWKIPTMQKSKETLYTLKPPLDIRPAYDGLRLSITSTNDGGTVVTEMEPETGGWAK
jgi:hypothetical protein